MEPQSNSAHRQLFIFAFKWVKQEIPPFAELLSTPHNFMEMDHTSACKRTKLSVFNMHSSTIGWEQTELHAFLT